MDVDSDDDEENDLSLQQPIDIPVELCEVSLEDESPKELPSDTRSFEINFELIDDSSKRGKQKLIDNSGFSYNIKYKGKKSTEWQCTKRPKLNPCRATVKDMYDGTYTIGNISHNHAPETGAAQVAKITTAAKKQAVDNLFKPAAQIVDEILMKELNDDRPCPHIPKPGNIARQANRKRQKIRPADPTNLEFELDCDNIPKEFLRGDVRVNNHRHLIFATNEQLAILSRAKNWYVDATFKLCREPFKQLFTINAFVRHEDYSKQVPLVYIIMSGRKKRHYVQVLQEVVNVLPEAPEVKKVVMDFEKALWKAFPLVFPNVSLMGCAFHWSQSVWRKIQDLGLVCAFNEDQGTHKFLKKLLALPYIPDDKIYEVFMRLQGNATTNALRQLMDYINKTWVETTTWPPSTWSVYGMSVRTNNDVEGWHNRLNRRAMGKAQLPLYMLIKLLHEESLLTKIYVRLVSEKKLKRIQRSKYSSLQRHIFDLWESYADRERNATQLLRACAHVATRQI
ncbi:hypothetical protein QZH41_020418 [Actinostola sp. cb2023]|nr:hypothetical protein QZH41_020418 [Actinostola sp. cb2023]